MAKDNRITALLYLSIYDMLSFVIKPLKSSVLGAFLFILVYYHLCNFGQNLDNVQN